MSVVTLAGAETAVAQSPRAERPYRGLFAPTSPDATQQLTAQGSLSGGYDSNLAADLLGNQQPIPGATSALKGGVAQFSGGLSYSLNLSNVAIGATASTSARYYPTLESNVVRRDYLSAGVAAPIVAGISASANVGYAPYSLHSLLAPIEDVGPVDPADPAAPVVPDWDMATSPEHFMYYAGGLDFTRRLSQHTTFDAGYSYRARNATSLSEGYQRQSIGARVSREISRDLSIRGGYRYTDALYGDDPSYGDHLIDVGVDYRRALSFSRRTTFSFGTGTSATTRPNPDGDDSTRFFLHINAVLNHELGRTWNANVYYTRGTRLSDSWTEPVFSDVVSASVGGLMGRRLQFRSSASATKGHSGFSHGPANTIGAYYGFAGLGYALSRYVNLGLSYAYYRHRLGEDVELPPGLTYQLDRHSVRASFSVWAPLFVGARRANVTG